MKNKQEKKVETLLVVLSNFLIKGALCLFPVMPKKSQEILEIFHQKASPEKYHHFVQNHYFESDFSIQKGSVLFPKIEEKKPQTSLDSKIGEEKVAQNLIGIENFKTLDIKIGTVKKAERIDKSQKLLCLWIDLGEKDLRQIVSGIAEFYSPESLIEKQVCVLSNLKPVRLMGIKSEGMILAVRDSKGLSLIVPDAPKITGSQVS